MLRAFISASELDTGPEAAFASEFEPWRIDADGNQWYRHVGDRTIKGVPPSGVTATSPTVKFITADDSDTEDEGTDDE